MYGIFNQKGFILPLTLVLCFLFPLAILAQIELYKTELRFNVEHEEIEHLKSLTQMGMAAIANRMQEETFTGVESGTLYFPTGTVEYVITTTVDNLVQVQGTSITNKQRKRFFQGIMDIDTKEIVNWVGG